MISFISFKGTFAYKVITSNKYKIPFAGLTDWIFQYREIYLWCSNFMVYNMKEEKANIEHNYSSKEWGK